MPNTIFTLNTNNALCDHSRESHEAAASRWGCDYIVLSQWPGDRRDIFGGKIQTHLLSNSDRCMWLDADTLVRSDCPSPFDLIPDTNIGGVPSLQDKQTHSAAALIQKSWKETSSLLNTSSTCEPTRYINTGVLVWTPSHHNRIWEWLDRHLPRKPLGPMVEQTAQNIAISLFTSTTLLPSTYNRLGPHVWTYKGPMDSYIYHFANYGRHRGNKHQALQRHEWNMSPTHRRLP